MILSTRSAASRVKREGRHGRPPVAPAPRRARPAAPARRSGGSAPATAGGSPRQTARGRTSPGRATRRPRPGARPPPGAPDRRRLHLSHRRPPGPRPGATLPPPAAPRPTTRRADCGPVGARCPRGRWPRTGTSRSAAGPSATAHRRPCRGCSVTPRSGSVSPYSGCAGSTMVTASAAACSSIGVVCRLRLMQAGPPRRPAPAARPDLESHRGVVMHVTAFAARSLAVSLILALTLGCQPEQRPGTVERIDPPGGRASTVTVYGPGGLPVQAVSASGMTPGEVYYTPVSNVGRVPAALAGLPGDRPADQRGQRGQARCPRRRSWPSTRTPSTRGSARRPASCARSPARKRASRSFRSRAGVHGSPTFLDDPVFEAIQGTGSAASYTPGQRRQAIQQGHPAHHGLLDAAGADDRRDAPPRRQHRPNRRAPEHRRGLGHLHGHAAGHRLPVVPVGDGGQRAR